MRARLFAFLALAACGHSASPAPPTETHAPEPAPTVEPHAPGPSVDAPALAAIRERSGCVFETVEALCEGLREHAGSTDQSWVSDGCALGPRTTTSGPFAEALAIGIRAGHERVDDTARVEHALLGSSVREPPGHEGETLVLLAARVGAAWFPIFLFHPITGELDRDDIDWALDPSGTALTWTDEEAGSRRDDPSGYGQVDRTIAVVARGVPVIAAEATIERWNGDVDLPCARACNGAASPPPYPECDRRCASSARATRTWEREGDVVRIGATQVVRTGEHAGAIDVTMEEAETVHLSAADPGMVFCAFMPAVHAVPRTSARTTDAQSVADRDRAHAALASGAFHEVQGAVAAAQPGAPRSIVAIDSQMGGACGGGGCTVGLAYRTVEGSLPEEGVSFFTADRGSQVGCDASALPDGAPTLVEVAPATSREAIACGFGTWDGSPDRYWVIVRVIDAPPLP